MRVGTFQTLVRVFSVTSCLLNLPGVFVAAKFLESQHDFLSRDEDGACAPGTRPRILTDQTGWIASPGYPEVYPNDANCQWLIIANKRTDVIRLDFDDLRTEAEYDVLTIYDGNTTEAPPIASFDGTHWSPAPSNVLSSGSSMLIVLISDGEVVETGFNVSYTSLTIDSVQTNDPCYARTRPLLLEEYNGTFQSNGYSNSGYWNYADCAWLIESQEPGGTVQLWFDSFATEPNYDVVWVYDGQNTAGRLVAILHGTSVPVDPPTVIRSRSQYLYVHFITDWLLSDIGFHAAYLSIPAEPTTPTITPPSTTTQPVLPCGSMLRVPLGDILLAPGYDSVCYLGRKDGVHLDTKCYDLIQDFQGIGNATSLVAAGGNFGCLLSPTDDFAHAASACYDNYQWQATLSQCVSCPMLIVCIRRH